MEYTALHYVSPVYITFASCLGITKTLEFPGMWKLVTVEEGKQRFKITGH